jgi:DNA polymerase-4
MDAFFASIEIRNQPRLRGLPVIVGGVTARGVVCAASYEARRFGVRSAMPTFKARKLCPQAEFVSPDMPKYARVSAEIHEIFSEFTSQIEPIAFDEAYLDVTGSLSIFHTPLELGRELKRRVHTATSLVVSVGIGPNKLVAKIACTLGKPDGLVVVPQAQVAQLLEPLPVRRLWGIGPVTEQALAEIGIATVSDLRNAPPEQLWPIFGTRMQEMLQMAWGNDIREVEGNRESQSIGEESTFLVDSCDIEAISPVITAHSEAVARRLRQLGLKAQTVTLKVRLARAQGGSPDRNRASEKAPRYPLLTRSKTLANCTQDDAEIRSIALQLWSKAAIREPVRLIGVCASHFQKSNATQIELFPAERKRDLLGETLDAIQSRFGTGAIRRAVAAPEKLTPSQQKKLGEGELSGRRRRKP